MVKKVDIDFYETYAFTGIPSVSLNSENYEKVNINTASLEELQSLSGIGEGKARAIIEYREENGNFTSIEDLLKVSGIGESIYEKIKDSITV